MAEEVPEHRDRLPTLLEVMGRRTLAPVDLFSFYIYMRDQQRSVDYLDFWLDVSQHMSLCRHYVRELHRSVLLETPELEKVATSKRSSQLLEHFDIGEAESHPSSNEKKSTDQRLSAFLRHDNGHAQKDGSGSGIEQSPARSMNSQLSRNVSRPSGDRASPSERPPRPSYMSTDPHTDSNSPGHTVARGDIKASAEKILYTFILPGSEREIVLPESILNRIIYHIEEEGRDDPEVFDDAKDYVFQAMERDAYPGFLQAKALGNLVPLSIVIRVVVGLCSLMAGFWGGFYMILTDKPHRTRCWVILPFALGTYLVMSYQYKLDIVAAYLGLSEYTFMNWSRIREPYVQKLLVTRASMTTILFTIVAVGLCLLFILVPGTHL
ncbi:hypothetical protein DV736_g3368, partial [Chaetothyriales sp. CBS 134916]